MKQAKEKLRKVTVMLPEELVKRATATSGEGLTPTIRRGLEKVVADDAYGRLRGLRGKVKFSLDFEQLRRDER